MATRNSQLSTRFPAAVSAVGLGVGLSLAQTGGCILPDYCIRIEVAGYDNCTYLQNAQMWPVGQKQLAQPVPASLGAPGPAGCVCANSVEQDVIDFEVPVAQYDELYDKIVAAARDACSALATPGWENNCYIDAGPDAAVPFAGTFNDGLGECIGSCSHVNPPPGESCPDPNPYECAEQNGETGGDSETGSGETGGGSDGTGGLDAGDYISCVGTDCDIDGDFARGLYADSSSLLREGTRLVYDPAVGRFVLQGVSSGTLASELGFRTGDVLDSVDGRVIDDLDAALRAFGDHEGAAALRVRVKRGTTWIDFDFDFTFI